CPAWVYCPPPGVRIRVRVPAPTAVRVTVGALRVSPPPAVLAAAARTMDPAWRATAVPAATVGALRVSVPPARLIPALRMMLPPACRVRPAVPPTASTMGLLTVMLLLADRV